jgi:mRNA-degrading endonuclease RelE of RelBE toxin-antitoxin system
MNYSVDWSDDAIATLAQIWLQAPDRVAITAAAATIDRLLAASPRANGTPVSEGLYAIEVSPLRVQFEISEENRVVTAVYVGLKR